MLSRNDLLTEFMAFHFWFFVNVGLPTPRAIRGSGA